MEFQETPADPGLYLPVRYQRTTRCHCVWIKSGVRHECYEPTDSPDSPFCPSCESRHADWTDPEVTISTYWPVVIQS